MAVQPAEPTDLLKIPIPGENSDPFMDQFREYTRVIEDGIFLRKLMVNFFLSAGGTRIWASGTGILTWTEDWIIPVFHWGRRINVVYGPDGTTRTATIPDGSALVVDIPSILNTNVTRDFRVVSQLNTNVNNEWVAGWNNDGVLQLRGIGEIT